MENSPATANQDFQQQEDVTKTKKSAVNRMLGVVVGVLLIAGVVIIAVLISRFTQTTPQTTQKESVVAPATFDEEKEASAVDTGDEVEQDLQNVQKDVDAL